MITRWLVGFFQGWPTRRSVSIVNPAPTVQNRDLPAVPPALLIPSPTRVPLFAISVIEINMQVCVFTFLMPTRNSHIISSWSYSRSGFASHHTHMQSHLHANTAFTAYIRVQRLCEVSVDLNVNCVFSNGLGFFFFFFYQRLVQRAANRDLCVQTVTTSTPTPHVTLRER